MWQKTEDISYRGSQSTLHAFTLLFYTTELWYEWMWGSANEGMRSCFLSPCPYSWQSEFQSTPSSSSRALGTARECSSTVPVQKVGFPKAHFSHLLKWLSTKLFRVNSSKDLTGILAFLSIFFFSPVYLTGLTHCSCDVADGNCFDNWCSEIPFTHRLRY